MKKIIILSPHFPPSNLAAVHRTRLFAQHLPDFGWDPIVVTVHENFYEEALDWNLAKLIPNWLRVEKVNAVPIKKNKIVGDIGLRGFWGLYKRTLKIVREENVAFLYIPIPSNYSSLIGRLVNNKTGIPYGIDYIDPWVHNWPEAEIKFSKAWISKQLANILEPIAVKKVQLITGVASGYYESVLERNPHLKLQTITAAMPYGGEERDYELLSALELQPYLFSKTKGTLDFVYGGAMLPKAYSVLEQILQTIAANKEIFLNCRFHFIGTGKSPNDDTGYNIMPYAEKYGLWQKNVFEYPKRIPYLDVLTHLSIADGAFILGSTEAHYTPSKVYQSVLSKKPVFAVLHKKSTACSVITKSKAGMVLSFDGEADLELIGTNFKEYWEDYLKLITTFNPDEVDKTSFEEYSAKNVTKILAIALDKIINR